jgi:lipopolysaccharide export system permease protein
VRGSEQTMTTIIDRQLIFNYFKAYLVCLVSLLGLFIVVDLFMNLDDFTNHRLGLGPVLSHIGVYYGQKSIQIFDRLCESIVLLAAMFTVAWMQRNNELLPLLSAGVSTRRVVRPVLMSACLMMSLAVLNKEVVMPNLDSYLLDNRGDPDGKKEKEVKGGFESSGVLISGKTAVKKEMLIKNFTVVFPPNLGGPLKIEAKEARYIPPGAGVFSGGWDLTGAQPSELDHAATSDVLTNISPGRYFLKTQEIDFDVLTRQKNWFEVIPIWQLIEEMGKTGSSKLASVAVVFHMRLTRPILGMILVFMGLSIILWDQNRNIFISAGLCLVLCAIFFAAWFGCKYLGDFEHLSPALSAWLPVMVFGPVSFVMFDAVHT